MASLIELQDSGTIVTCGAGMSRATVHRGGRAGPGLARRARKACLQDVASQHPTDVSPGLWDEVKAVLDSKGL